jgi:lipopolysaccharide transport system ATP-binding protein
MSVVIKVENISKQYRLGDVGTGALAHDVNKWWHKVRGKENPYLKIGETNDRATKGDSDYVWALKDINFEVKQGEVLGIIGRNGAGKSTLLKILSKTTTPTTGSIKIKGRIASLLEVGTGFHPELSGRENIFLNGAILGMTKKEIKSKFDEIVDFAGVERYIDTPVKRYSSGMYVRLAFGVAAHLEPEILIVDEVLAVGDAEFQKKALGKMKEVSEQGGRTVLFVSHNMAALKRICNTGIIIKDGLLIDKGTIQDVVSDYLNEKGGLNLSEINFNSKDKRLQINSIKINGNTTNFLELNTDALLEICIEGEISEDMPINLEVRLFTNEYLPLAFFSPGHLDSLTDVIAKGNFSIRKKIQLPQNMNQGNYLLKIALSDPGKQSYGEIQDDIQVLYNGVMTESGLVFDSIKTGWLLLK